MPLYRTTFEVVGLLPFPLDMLRHDMVYSSRVEDAEEIRRNVEREGKPRRIGGEPYRIRLTGIHHVRNVYPTIGRWASFGWSVDVRTLRTENFK